MSHEQSTATIKCPQCNGSGIVYNGLTYLNIVCPKCLGNCYVMNTPEQESLVEKMVSDACDAQEQFTEDELEQHANLQQSKPKIDIVDELLNQLGWIHAGYIYGQSFWKNDKYTPKLLHANRISSAYALYIEYHILKLSAANQTANQQVTQE